MLIQPTDHHLTGGPTVSNLKKPQPSDFSSVLSSNTAKLTGHGPKDHLGTQNATIPMDRLVTVGTISSKNPTVSNLLIRNSALKKDCWGIIHDTINKDKPYRKIQAGTTIYYDPKTKELLWGDMIDPKPAMANQAIAASSSQLGKEPSPSSTTTGSPDTTQLAQTISPAEINENLVEAIQPMIGKTYSDIDCYELLVGGLSNLGYTYTGKHGFGRKLINMALNKGLPMNAYLNGEGLVKLSGDQVYARSFMKIHHPNNQAADVIKELQPYLKKGVILSFSTESRGHTGIISNKDGAWTFINSGVLDNSLGDRPVPKGVGEEDLNKEIYNWFKLAAQRKESLKITIGQLNEEKLASYYHPEDNKIT